MGRGCLYRNVRRMTLDELKHEQELLGPFIRDVVAAKQARRREVSEEIERRSSRDAKKRIRRK
jgi:hypothetical protein